MDQNEITASELKAHCGSVLRRVAQGRQPVVVTRHGRPVARIVPIEPPGEASMFGFARGSISVGGDLMSPIDVRWDATQ